MSLKLAVLCPPVAINKAAWGRKEQIDQVPTRRRKINKEVDSIKYTYVMLCVYKYMYT